MVANGPRAFGVIYLKDVVKGGIKERFKELRRMGIKTVMIDGRGVESPDWQKLRLPRKPRC